VKPGDSAETAESLFGKMNSLDLFMLSHALLDAGARGVVSVRRKASRCGTEGKKEGNRTHMHIHRKPLAPRYSPPIASECVLL
jgi:hypothetical protein